MTELLRDAARVVTLPDGTRALVVDTEPPEDAPPEIREGLARRRIANSTGRCPCGGGWRRPNRSARRKASKSQMPIRVAVWHEQGCPASDAVLLPLVRAWVGGRR